MSPEHPIDLMPPEAANPMSQARHPDDLATLVFAGVITQGLRAGRRPLIRGLSNARFQKLLNEFFLGMALDNGSAQPATSDEFDELVALLLHHRAAPSEQDAWLAYAVATAAVMGENHLWQDMGLPSRRELSELMREHFPTLAAKNTGDMKWKKFFYRQLCELADVPVCKSPHCAECIDYGDCFGTET